MEMVLTWACLPSGVADKEVQSFLGFTNFYQWFIQDFSHHACPLFDLTLKDQPWQWTDAQQVAFKTLKHAVTS